MDTGKHGYIENRCDSIQKYRLALPWRNAGGRSPGRAAQSIKKWQFYVTAKRSTLCQLWWLIVAGLRDCPLLDALALTSGNLRESSKPSSVLSTDLLRSQLEGVLTPSLWLRLLPYLVITLYQRFRKMQDGKITKKIAEIFAELYILHKNRGPQAWTGGHRIMGKGGFSPPF
jgi:hypothetical protein